MAKRSPYLEKMLTGVETKVIDQNAVSCAELTPILGYQRAQVQRFANAKVEEGAWERVWKRAGNRLVPAYRPKK